jgi:hypothetical protein
MGFLSSLLGTRRSASAVEERCRTEFDASGKVVQVEVPQGQWTLQRKGPNSYYTQSAGSLLEAAEILKKIGTIPQLTYYTVDTPDGALARDVNGYYTEAAIKTKNLAVGSRRGDSGPVEFSSLMGFGDMLANQTSVAQLKQSGEYARLVLLMKCGRCGYESPVETQAGEMVRECYCCGAQNKGHRGKVSMFLGTGPVEI